jgi:hypothetical protein
MASYRLSIEPLGYSNYPIWQQRMKDVLRKEGLLGAVEPKQEGNTGLSEAEESKALGLVRMHLDDSKLSEVQDMDTALKVWVCLASTHKKGAVAQRFQLRSEWTGLRQHSGERIASYVQRLRAAAANMRASGQAVDTSEEVMTLLHGLTDSFRTIVSVYQVSPTPPENLEAVLPSLLMREQELLESSGEDAYALYGASSKVSKRGGRFSSRSAGSHSHSHSSGLSAQAAYAGRAGGQSVMGTGRQIQRATQQQPGEDQQESEGSEEETAGTDGIYKDVKCYRCGMWGHFSNKCPKGGNTGGARLRAYTAATTKDLGEKVYGMSACPTRC